MENGRQSLACPGVVKLNLVLQVEGFHAGLWNSLHEDLLSVLSGF